MSYAIREESVRETEVLSSRFIALLRPCIDEQDFARFMKETEERYPKAAHYCYGARFGVNEKMGDDGEPSRSAGFQILSTLRYRELENAALIIVRYFGGTKLGLPRLTRTYRSAAEEICDSAILYRKEEGIRLLLSSEYRDLERIRYLAKIHAISIENTEFGEKVEVEITGKKEAVEEFLRQAEYASVLGQEKTEIYRRTTHDTSE